jgi:hypothetical protein
MTASMSEIQSVSMLAESGFSMDEMMATQMD